MPKTAKQPKKQTKETVEHQFRMDVRIAGPFEHRAHLISTASGSLHVVQHDADVYVVYFPRQQGGYEKVSLSGEAIRQLAVVAGHANRAQTTWTHLADDDGLALAK